MKPLVTSASKADPKYRKLMQIWNQLFFEWTLWRYFEDSRGAGSVNHAYGQLVIPHSLKNVVLRGVHEGSGGGHFGVDKSLEN